MECTLTLTDIPGPSRSNFRRWTGERTIQTLGTNAGAVALPFQGWRKFKEAFAPELIERAVNDSANQISTVLDPFGGSGTTALAAQFLGLTPTTIEINPFLADLIEAKLCSYEISDLADGLESVLSECPLSELEFDHIKGGLPPSFVEPGIGERWIFGATLAKEIFRIRRGIENLPEGAVRRLLTVLLASASVNASNIVVSGKGRRYRKSWETKETSPEAFRATWIADVGEALRDISQYTTVRSTGYHLLRGDARSLIRDCDKTDLAVYSPPYPNSFDYTDVYNVELWVAGYLKSRSENTELRNSTLSSHVQIARNFSPPPKGSKKLDLALLSLEAARSDLWSRQIPDMVGGYFADLLGVMRDVAGRLEDGGTQWLVVGDSRYAGIDVPVAAILEELWAAEGGDVLNHEPFRSMRSAPQQGGKAELLETLLVLR